MEPILFTNLEDDHLIINFTDKNASTHFVATVDTTIDPVLYYRKIIIHLIDGTEKIFNIPDHIIIPNEPYLGLSICFRQQHEVQIMGGKYSVQNKSKL